MAAVSSGQQFAGGAEEGQHVAGTLRQQDARTEGFRGQSAPGHILWAQGWCEVPSSASQLQSHGYR